LALDCSEDIVAIQIRLVQEQDRKLDDALTVHELVVGILNQDVEIENSDFQR